MCVRPGGTRLAGVGHRPTRQAAGTRASPGGRTAQPLTSRTPAPSWVRARIPEELAVLPETAVPTPSDAVDLLAAAARCDEQAWAELVTRHRALLTAVTRRHGLSADEAADVVQETWVRFVQQLPAIRDAERVPGWLATTARRECVARRRRAWRESVTWDGDCPEMPADLPDPVDRLDAQHRAEQLWTAVRQLPERERALVEALLEPEPLTYAEIAQRLGMPIGSIGPVRGRALRHLRAALLLAQHPDEEPLSA